MTTVTNDFAFPGAIYLVYWRVSWLAPRFFAGGVMADRSLELSAVDLVTAIARTLVDRPEEVLVSKSSTEDCTVLRLRVDLIDVGKVIGKQGRTARSIRTLLGAISVKHRHRYALEILEYVDADSEDK